MNKAVEDTIQLLALRWVDDCCWTVRQQQQVRSLYMDQQCQSQLQLMQPNTLIYPHLRWLADVSSDKAELEQGLLIGIGGGDWLRFCNAQRPHQQWTAIDNQAHLLEWLVQYFELPLQNYDVADALAFLQQSQARYDMMFIDLYPWPSCWQQLLQLALARLHQGGWMAINITAETPETVLAWLTRHGFAGQVYQPSGYKNLLWFSKLD